MHMCAAEGAAEQGIKGGNTSRRRDQTKLNTQNDLLIKLLQTNRTRNRYQHSGGTTLSQYLCDQMCKKEMT